MKTLSCLLQSIACLWLAMGMASTLHGGVIINSYRFVTAGGGGGTDPSFASVVLLLHGEGADQSTTFTDSSTGARPISQFGNSELDTAEYKYGTASIKFDGTGDYITAPSSTDWNFGNGDFTVEFWIKWNAFPAASGTIIGNYPGTWALQYRPDTSNKINWYNGSSLYSASLSLSTGIWYHFAVCRSGSSLRIFVDGGQSGATATDSTNYNSTNSLTIGELRALGQNINGWLDDIRITKGVGRYTSNFTPPTAAFPDS
ncbi:LamG domain-containing protein [Prosthecobacter sp.]|jgi:hypothetical protein|uniref:LamG domain-containing protein n=1 Tax=Prosthecobacter sp. TaxID=1965333 RepID=UPI0037C5B1BE